MLLAYCHHDCFRHKMGRKNDILHFLIIIGFVRFADQISKCTNARMKSHKIAYICNAQKSFAAGAPPQTRWESL